MILNKKKILDEYFFYFLISFLFVSLVTWSWNDLSNFFSYEISSLNLAKKLSWQSLLKNYELNDGYAPFILIFFFKIINFFGGSTFVALLDRIVFPSFCIYFAFLIYKRDVPSKIALCLAILSIIFFTDLPLRDVIGNILSFNIPNYYPETLEISSGDFYSASLLSSLVVIYFSTNKQILSVQYALKFSFLYSILVYLNPFDFVYTTTFWIIFLTLKIYRSIHFNKSLKILLLTSSLFLIALITNKIFLNLLNEKSPLDANLAKLNFNFYKIFLYCVLPIFFIFIIKRLFRIDYYEIIIRFWPIYCVLLIELIVNIFFNFFPIKFVNENLLNNRIPQFFFHFYYYVPIIHFILRDNKTPAILKGNFKKIYKVIIKNLNLCAFLISFLIILKLFYFSIVKISSLSSEQIENELNFTLNSQGNHNDIYISDNFITELNLLINLNVRKKSGLFKGFIEKRSDEDLSNYLLNLVIFCKLNKWSNSECINFFSPGNIYKKNKKIFLQDKMSLINSGVGYFLYFNYNIIDDEKLYHYHQKITKFFGKDLELLLEASNIDNIIISKDRQDTVKITEMPLYNKKIKIYYYDK